MPYEKVKIYSDGSHYIGIPHTTRPKTDRAQRLEEIITVYENDTSDKEKSEVQFELANIDENLSLLEQENFENESNLPCDKTEKEEKSKRSVKKVTTWKEIFEALYRKYGNKKKKDRRKAILEEMKPLFKFKQMAEEYVDKQLERKQRNLISRRIRLCRKINLQQDFNYFATFTYDSTKTDEKSFKTRLIRVLSKLAKNKGWKYLGVWERSPEKNRLHFHGLFSIPDGTMPSGGLYEVKDYSIRLGKMQTTYQNTYFLDRFGRNDFEEIVEKTRLGEAIAYIMKYLEKSGGKIVCSKNLPQYFVSDIWEEDVVCNIGMEERKLLLFDDFTCWDEGVYIGVVSPEIIAQMPKANV